MRTRFFVWLAATTFTVGCTADVNDPADQHLTTDVADATVDSSSLDTGVDSSTSDTDLSANIDGSPDADVSLDAELPEMEVVEPTCESPVVVALSPESGSASVDPGAPIDVELSCAPEEDFDETVLRVYSEARGLLPGVYNPAVDGSSTYRFTPSESFLPGDRLHVIVALETPWVGAFRAATVGAVNDIELAQRESFGADNYNATLADFDADGDLDAYFARGGYTAGKVEDQILTNLPANGVRFSSTLALPTSDTRAVATGDFNSDGLIDIATVHRLDPPSIVHNSSSQPGTWMSSLPLGEDQYAVDIAVGDLNGDFHLDVVTVSLDDSQVALAPTNFVFLNNGNGTFAPGVEIGAAGSTNAVAIADLNGDGALDIILGNHNANDTVWLNDGAGSFAPGTELPASDGGTTSIATGDLNGDSAPDLITCQFLRHCRTYINDGNGNFGAGAPLLYERVYTVRLGDLDGDGDLDAVFASVNDTNLETRFGLNDGSGQFVLDTGGFVATTAEGRTRALALGDLDGDGDLDVVTGEHTTSGESYWWENLAR